jgi:hypothetical protein
MRQIFASLVATLFLALGTPSQAQDNPIEAVINDQITAFLADDFDTAFTYASPNIRQLFGSAQRFGQMVRDGYPMVHRPAEVRMLEQRPLGAGIDQRVLIRDAAGAVHLLSYMMIETPQGWQINGVQILRAPEIGV